MNGNNRIAGTVYCDSYFFNFTIPVLAFPINPTVFVSDFFLTILDYVIGIQSQVFLDSSGAHFCGVQFVNVSL